MRRRWRSGESLQATALPPGGAAVPISLCIFRSGRWRAAVAAAQGAAAAGLFVNGLAVFGRATKDDIIAKLSEL